METDREKGWIMRKAQWEAVVWNTGKENYSNDTQDCANITKPLQEIEDIQVGKINASDSESIVYFEWLLYLSQTKKPEAINALWCANVLFLWHSKDPKYEWIGAQEYSGKDMLNTSHNLLESLKYCTGHTFVVE